MRSVITLGFLLILTIGYSSAQEKADIDEKDPYEWSAKMGAADSMGWYVLAEPLRDYTVLKTDELDVTNTYIEQLHLKQLYNIVKYRGIQLKKQYPTADGLLMPDGRTLKLIRYTDDTERHRRIGNVQTVAGKQVYLWNEPLKVNNNAFRLPAQGPLEAQRHYLKQGLEVLVKKAKRISQEQDKPFDALVIHKDHVQAIQYYTSGSS